MVEVARDEAEAGRREGVTRSSTVLEVGLCAGAHWGAMAGFCVTPSGWVPDRIFATPRLLLLPRASPGTKEPPLQASTQHPQSPGGPLTRPVSSPSTPSVSSTTLAKLLALDEEREKSFSTSALWAAVSALPQTASHQAAPTQDPSWAKSQSRPRKARPHPA